ncbi:hypothetical protein Kpol_1060p26 [Vanderwaltozyma polyspora DSM 70294]|uniref:Schlafen group 3-like DNA/RNA helicase domain-containing protein n=1 Tax=Vanderwaltozyma polyspora (strain ATCC 22028 / DSM 70294 / BCRC 21397 / CBS 2163 / NBRC 10782 / NRRL Y-8283 / UCD 57-17) TaxID=436907 RepID=A7TK24_VANPO|nr:uncharacterized protein Kpol_1060p26 [Vanderwaltozyma polyspora DSM 70294]EDO17370.1 hypothetical protein Kpol_1060p26 [Vanderwaltozyma polyspora DSM 70294]
MNIRAFRSVIDRQSSVYRGIMTQPSRNFKRARRNGQREDVVSNAMNKLSHVELSDEQKQLRSKVMGFIRDNLSNYDSKEGPAMYVIEGNAGTGKSVILNALFDEIQKIANTGEDPDDVLNNTSNYLVVNHPEMLKLYVRISKSLKYVTKSSLERPTSLINALGKSQKMADVVIIDEAHLLSTSKDAFKRFYGQNQLEELMKISKVLVLVYDDKQALRMGSYWDENTRNGSNLKAFYDMVPKDRKGWYNLKQQFRVTAPDDVLNWIHQISTVGAIPEFPKSSLKDDSKDNGFDFKIWDDCGEMYDALRDLDTKYGQCRMLATYDFPYRLDGKDYYVTCGDSFKVRWDRYTPREVTPWSERADTIDEVGSVYTIQGFDLNYAGVILGRSVTYDAANDCLKLDIDLYDDHAGFTKKKNIHDVKQVKEKIIMNSINVLLTRGVKGLYVYAWDPELRERLRKSQQV